MVDPVSSSSPSGPAAPSSADPSTAGNIVANSEGGGGGGYTTKTNVRSLAELREVAPQVYNAMMQGIAQRVCSDNRRHNDHLIRLMREGRRNAAG